MSSDWNRLVENQGLFRDALSRDADLIFRNMGPLADECETFVKATGGGLRRIEATFGSRDSFADEVFRLRLQAMQSHLLMTILATFTVIGIPPLMWIFFQEANGEALQLAWQIPFVFLLSVIISAFLATVAMVLISYPAAWISRGYLSITGRPQMAWAWQHLTLG